MIDPADAQRRTEIVSKWLRDYPNLTFLEQQAVYSPGPLMYGEVEIGSGCEIAHTAIIIGPCKIGNNVKISHYVVIGEDAEHRKGDTDREQCITIGDDTVIREHAVVQRGLKKHGDASKESRYFGTSIGARCYIMHGAHVAHDCQVGDDVTLSPYVVLGGHTVVLDGANLGIGASTHQNTTIGACAMVGMGAVVIRDVATTDKVVGVPAKCIGGNIPRVNYSADRLWGELTSRFLALSCRPVE